VINRRLYVYNDVMPAKRRFQVFLEEHQLTAMRSIEATTGAPVAAQVRLAIDAWLAARGADVAAKPKPRRIAKKGSRS
jgi:hypothetical protein